MLELQQTAGNAAVVGLLQLQRQAAPPTAAPTIDDRLKEAAATATKQWFKEQVKTAYEQAPDAGEAVWLGSLRAELGVDDIAQPGRKDRALRAWTALQRSLAKGLTAALVDRFRAQAADIAGTGVTTAAKTTLNAAPLSGNDLTNSVWVDELGNGRITALPRGARSQATRQWKALRKRLGPVLGVWAKEKTALTVGAVAPGAAPAANQVTPELVAAAKQVVRATPTWIATPSQIGGFTKQVETAVSASGPELQNAARTHGMGLLAMAETAIIKEDMAGVPGVDKLSAAAWLSEGKTYYQSFLTEPIWLYFKNRVADIKFLGFSPSKKHGLNQELEPMLRAVEASMMRQKGAKTVAELGVHKLFGIRFQTSGAGEHARARAFDLSPAWKNPMVKEQHLTMASVLAGEWLHKINAVMPEGRRAPLLAKIRVIVDEQHALRAALKAGGDKAGIEARLKQLDADLAAVHATPEVTDYVKRSLAAKAKLEGVKAKIATSWADLTKGNADAAEIKKRFQKKVDAVLAAEQKSAATFRSALLAIELLKKVTKDANQAKVFDVLAAPHKASLAEVSDHITRLEALKKTLAGKGNADSLLGSATQRDTNPTAKQMAEHGIIDMPDWFVAAFMENGWRWGGAGWGEGSGRDTMHLEYMGPLGGLK